ncbi:MAG: OB-fold domain-containing protein [Acidobacteria bacterium]|nr:OB-fold domain-containing protein [Acidobacteriota bacterium]
MKRGVVYTETIVHSPPELFAREVPYQLAIIDLEGGGRVTVRIAGERVAIGDTVKWLESRNGIDFFEKTS